MRLIADADLSEPARAVFEDIRATRKTEYVNNFWRAMAHDPAQLKRTWEEAKGVMGAGALDPMVKELIYLAVSITNGCTYCIASHGAAARAKGMSEPQYLEMLAVIGLANKTNRLATAMQVPVDPMFRPEE